jgi:CRP-like cAMP-binding protein
MDSSHSHFSANHVLASLPATELTRLKTHLTPSQFPLRHTLWERGDSIDAIYFLKSGVTSLVLTSESGIDVEVGMVGPEGVVGAVEALGNGKASTRAVTQLTGSGWKLFASLFREEFARGGPFQEAVLLANDKQSFQTAQCVLCNRLHPIDQRLSRWLLMAHDRSGGINEMKLTHEFIAAMLGARRAGITVAAGQLRTAGLIDYARGRVIVLDRSGLEKTACECYDIIQNNLNSA